MSSRTFFLSVFAVILATALILAVGPARWPVVQVVPVTRGDLTARFVTSGEVRAEVCQLSAPGAGRVDEVLVKEQDPVRKGQLLLSLENVDAQDRLQGAQNAFWTAQAELNARRERLQLTREQLTDKLRQAREEEARARRRLDVRAGAALQEAQAGVEERKAEQSLAEGRLKRLEAMHAEGIVARREVELAALEAQQARARLRQAQARVAAARQSLGRARQQAADELARCVARRREAELALREERPLEQELEGSRLGVVIRSQALASSRFAVRSRSLLSPVEGSVWRCLVSRGEMVVAGQPLLRILGSGERWVEAWISEQDVALATPGQAVALRASSHQTARGIISRVDPALEHPPEAPGTGRYLRVVISLQDQSLKPGTPVEVEGTRVLAHDVPLAARSALFERDGKTWVAAVQGGRIQVREVKPGPATPEGAAVEGLEPGLPLVVDNPASLEAGERVRAVRLEQN